MIGMIGFCTASRRASAAMSTTASIVVGICQLTTEPEPMPRASSAAATVPRRRRGTRRTSSNGRGRPRASPRRVSRAARCSTTPQKVSGCSGIAPGISPGCLVELRRDAVARVREPGAAAANSWPSSSRARRMSSRSATMTSRFVAISDGSGCSAMRDASSTRLGDQSVGARTPAPRARVRRPARVGSSRR